MKNLIVDLDDLISDESQFKAEIPQYGIDIVKMQPADDVAEKVLALVSSKQYGKFAVLLKSGSACKKSFPNNAVEVADGVMESDIKKITTQVCWIFSNNGKDKPMSEKVWFISDTHFSHGNIIRYCNRPWNSGKGEDGEIVVAEKDIYAMNEALIANWNSTIGEDDVVWHLGDFALGNRSRIPEFVSRLNGHKKLVLGNHDFFHVDKTKFKSVVDFFEKAGFEEVYAHPVLLNDFVILSHEPLMFVKDPFFNIFGHVHNNDNYKTFSRNGCCVCVEKHDYMPVSWKTIKDNYDSIVKN